MGVALFLLALTPAPHQITGGGTDTALTSGNATQMAPGDVIAGLPVSFEANRGQIDTQVAFSARANGYRLFLTAGEAVFSFNGPKNETRAEDSGAGPARGESAVVRMGFVGANRSPEIEGVGLQGGVTNYFRGSDPSAWQTNVPNYDKVYYRGLWPGIDLAFYSRADRSVEYDFIVAPGADPGQISLTFEGAKDIHIDDGGNLAISTSAGEVVHQAPVIYQEIGGDRREVAGQYRLDGEALVGFAVGSFDNSLPLVIDPVIAYSSYLGGSLYEGAENVAVDASENVYLAGSTESTNFPTASPLQATMAGSQDAFITKVNPSGSGLVYSSYLGGGSGYSRAAGVAIDASGNAYLIGETTSPTFPVVSPFQATYGGGQDVFVAKVNPSGSALVYSSYLGGSAGEANTRGGIAVDSTGAAYLTGGTSSTNFPVLSPFQATYGGGTGDAFVTKVNPSGSALVYSSYLGGSASDGGSDIALDATGAAYLSGTTRSTNFPTASPFQATFGGCGTCVGGDAFVTKVNPSGSAKVYSSYLGGSDNDSAYAIAVDSVGAAYLSGSTRSTNFPTTAPFQGTHGGGLSDAFVSKVNPSGSAKVYSTYLGGSGNDSGLDVAVDPLGSAYITGQTGSTDFPTARAFQATYAGDGDAFITKMNPTGSTLVYSSFLGGSGSAVVGASETGSGIALDSDGSAYVTGWTNSTDFPTKNPFQGALGGEQDAFFTKIGPVEVISGTFANSSGSRVSAYRMSDGVQVGTTFSDGSGNWSLEVPGADDCISDGYKILAEAPSGYLSRWYNLADNYSSADCVSAPGTGINMTLPVAGEISGTVTDDDTGLLLDGALIYLFRSTDGAFVGWTKSGYAGTGKYKISADGGFTYKILIVPPSPRASKWYGGESWSTASSVPVGTTADFNLASAPSISGYVKSAQTAADINGAVIYIFRASDGAFVGWSQSGSAGPGRYSVVGSAGESYRVLVHADDAYEDLWSDGAPGYLESTPTPAPSAVNFSLRPAAMITGVVSHLGSGENDVLVSAYTTCGCTSPQNTLSGPGGTYSLKVVTTDASGWQYRIRFIRPNGASAWYVDSSGFGGAANVTAPATAINQDVPG